jgi:protein-tyrosine phosphatase
VIESQEGLKIPGIEVPREFYWVLVAPAPLAGMKFPRADFPWGALADAGFSKVLALYDQSYDPKPLTRLPAIILQDLFHGGPPKEPREEEAKVSLAVRSVVAALHDRKGVVVHCEGGSGRTGTVIGCVLRHFGYPSEAILPHLDRLQKARGKVGWPESPWQAAFVRDYVPDA